MSPLCSAARAAVALSVAAAVLSVSCAGAPSRPDGAPDSGVEAARALELPTIEERRTSNGIRIFVLRDAKAPVYMQNFWFQVGSANEREAAPGEPWGTTGLSHFFEHLMFRGTEKHPDYFEEMSRMGGQVNAFTWLDETVYWEKVPSRFLEQAIEMEADRIRNLEMDFLNLEPEREVVKSERLMRTENSPIGKLGEQVDNLAYTRSPYRWPTVGWMRDLIAIPIEEAERYYKTHYKPNNLFVIFVGDVDADEVAALMEKHFADLEAGPLPPEPDLHEPPQTAQRRTSVLMGVETAQLKLAFHTPPPHSEAFMRFEVLDALLTNGRSSLLQRALVYSDNPVATEVSSFLFPMRGNALYEITVKGLPGRGGAELMRRVQGVLNEVGRRPLDHDVLERAVRGLQGRLVRYMKTIYGRAQVMGFWQRATDDPLRPFRNLANYAAVTPEHIQELAAAWVNARKRTVGFVVNPAWVITEVGNLLPEGPQRDRLTEIVGVCEQLRAERGMRAEVALEARAIELLGERAARARAQYAETAPDKVAELDTYLQEGEKGTKRRSEKLAAQRKELAALRSAREEARRRFELAMPAAVRGEANRAERNFLGWLAEEAADRSDRASVPPSLRIGVKPNEQMAYALAGAFALKVRGDDARLRAFIERALEEIPDALTTEAARDLLQQLLPIPASDAKGAHR